MRFVLPCPVASMERVRGSLAPGYANRRSLVGWEPASMGGGRHAHRSCILDFDADLGRVRHLIALRHGGWRVCRDRQRGAAVRAVPAAGVEGLRLAAARMMNDAPGAARRLG